mmetsp:Transcript_12186/g.31019  ORF Transcript_12186/g.31019 Transcript_12186/m.31019 type:complete len:268 (+) Transcript_12186:135-938(+)|eukprot:CAMPEP_0198241090 /NCGR_PEP_ID=MMETSP1446-20131203/5994_1 /TAXON_ID=1461542 ORGANISM="Unidentified sp, Strain CCMP2111" /NCGR_SAMPLE_ID=MMETSP1446 /ASSEMBLY_ACC=CAM_ASM_001112 /LENGTH=267 /DNA_ID=CAMNT_0043923889 /DNA_START=116 /DNA_END=919 /DNA_ORIENTATION=-
MKNKLMGAVTAAAFSLSAFVGSVAHAANIDLAFIMDASGSVGSTNFNNAMDSLADALEANIPVGTTDTYRIGVVTFSNTAQLTTLRTINSAQDLADTANDIRNQSFIGSTTNYRAAFDLVRTSFAGLGALGDSSIVNMMTDGEPFGGLDPNGQAVIGRDALKNAGWDSLSFESVTNGADNAFLSTLGFDALGDGATIIGGPGAITDPLNDAFVLPIADFGTDYDIAIDQKVRRIVTPGVIPLPAALPLLGGGVLFLGLIGRRRKAAA